MRRPEGVTMIAIWFFIQSSFALLGLGGIRSATDALEFLIAGATAVAVGTASFVTPDCAAHVVDGLRDYCARMQIDRLGTLTGSLDGGTG